MEIFWEYLGNAGAVVFVFLALGFCIFSHELGHFLAAKLMGLHVDAFSLGFRPFWRKKYKGVEYRLGWLPFGGYVELPQIDASDAVPKSADGRELPKASPLARIVTAAAGPLFNIISGLLIGCIVWVVGIPQATPKMREITVHSIPENSPEYRAGLRRGDVIVKLNGEEFFDTWQKFVEKILYTIDDVTLDVRRNGETVRISYLPQENPDAPGNAGKEKLAYPFFTPLIPIKLYPESGSIAEKAGIRPGDTALSVNGVALKKFEDFISCVNFSNGKVLTIELLRDNKNITLQCTPQEVKGKEENERFLTGFEFFPDSMKVKNVMPGGSAKNAGMLAGDEIISINGKKVNSMNEFQDFTAKNKNTPFTVQIKRQGKDVELTLVPQRFAAYQIGVRFAMYDHPDPWQQFVSVLDMSWKSLRGIATTIGNKLAITESSSSLKPAHMSGTLGIGVILFNSIRTSFAYGIYFIAVISFALAIFNLLPLPVLDGGHIFFGVFEVIFRRPFPTLVLKVLTYIFIGLLIMLMVFVTFSDIRRLVWQIMS